MSNERTDRMIERAPALDQVLRELCEWEAGMGHFESRARQRARQLLAEIDGVVELDEDTDD